MVTAPSRWRWCSGQNTATGRCRRENSAAASTPGGAKNEGEAPRTTARREVAEEIWPVPRYYVTGIELRDCGGGWQFHIVCADVHRLFTAHAVRERLTTGWFAIEEMSALPLIPGFRRWVDERTASSAQ